ncbi:AaceriACR005Wp [[Ashbya] aceris (nom. inval.)]|nr:AaceriACR005Wp [[Ashbya] aceris (nom. inval.)]
MSPSNKDIAALVVNFLSTSAKTVGEDYEDSLKVAIDCITEAFELGPDEAETLVSEKYGGKNLSQLLTTGVTHSSVAGEPNVAAEEVKKEAEVLKLEGNRAMASKDYDTAIEKYTAAIEVLPTDAVYYANRAAAYSSLQQYEKAVEDAKKATEVDPSYSKGFSRLGYAKYALGKHEEALEAYKKVLDIEGDNATEAMRRDYESAKRKVEQSINMDRSADGNESRDAAESSAGGSGMPDLSSMLGGGLGGGLGGLLNNPQVMQAAQQMMQNPSAIQEMMNNPAIKKMAENFASGNGSSGLGDMMSDPAIRNMASKFFGPK